jgi:error-prone DNA polymerase
MRIAIECAGFEPAKADKLRRAMATFKRTGTIHKLKDEFIQGMERNEYPREFAERCFAQIEGFGEYGFPESHAASFALLVYASCWFKAFYPDVFCAAILNAQPMGFYAPAQLVRDAQDHGVAIHDVDINHSDWDCTLEERAFDAGRMLAKHAEMRGVIRTRHAVRLGFRQIKGLSEKSMLAFVARRGDGYESLRDVWLRSGLDVGEIERLAQADAFRSIGLDRRQALWAVRGLDAEKAADRLPLFDQPEIRLVDNEPATRLPVMPLGQHVIHDYKSLSLSLKAHPVRFVRDRLDRAGIMPNASLPSVPNGRRVVVSGLILVRQRPGKGNAIFLTLEDEGGIANIIVWKRDFDRLLPVIMGSKFVRVAGKLQTEMDVIHIVADRIDDLTSWLTVLLEGADRSGEQSGRSRDGQSVKTGLAPFVRKNGPVDQDMLAREAGGVMPKGRNFQ